MSTSRTSGNRSIEWSRILVEGGVVVLSILLALALDEWRRGIRDHDIEREYLARLLFDIDANIVELDQQHAAQASQLSSARLVYPLVSRSEWANLDTSTAVRAAYFATPSPTPTWATTTLEELIGTGRMALITSAALRTEILEYYRFLEARDFAYQLMSTAYREAVRRRMDPDLQLRLRTCRPRSPDCPVEVTAPDLRSFLDWLSGNEAVADGLRRVIVQWTRAEEEFLPQVEERTLALKALVEAELNL